MDSQYRDTLDFALMNEKYGLKPEPNFEENLKLSKVDLKRLVENQRNQLEIKDS